MVQLSCNDLHFVYLKGAGVESGAVNEPEEPMGPALPIFTAEACCGILF